VSGGHQKYFGKTQQRKLVKTRRDSAKVHAECRVCVFVIDVKVHDQQYNDDRMARSKDKFHFGYQTQRLHFIVLDTGSWRSQGSKSRTGTCEMRNPETVTSTRVSDTGNWRSQESRIFIIGVLKC
jgi:hypothetical protein